MMKTNATMEYRSNPPQMDEKIREGIAPRRRRTTNMNASDPLPKGAAQSQGSRQEKHQQQALHQQSQKKGLDGTATSTGQGTCRIGSAMSGLEKALDALFKAQDHLNTAADQGGDGLSKMIEGISRNLRGLQRELSQAIYRLDNSR
jgi:hypothetical protein